MKRIFLIFWTLAFGSAACGADTPPPPPSGPIPSMVITNQSQYRLIELRIHQTSSYLESPNVLPAPLEIDGDLVYYGTGDQWFTVIREKSEHGRMLAFTIAEPVTMQLGTGYDLTIFDEAFRITPSPYVRPDQFEGLIVGDPGPPCTWTSTITTSTCSG